MTISDKIIKVEFEVNWFGAPVIVPPENFFAVEDQIELPHDFTSGRDFEKINDFKFFTQPA